MSSACQSLDSVVYRAVMFLSAKQTSVQGGFAPLTSRVKSNKYLFMFYVTLRLVSVRQVVVTPNPN
jgi:hypothetical protein